MSLDGLRAWIGEVERKLGARTRVFLVLAAIAVGGAAAGVYLGLDARSNDVSKSDVEAVETRLLERIEATGPAQVSELETRVEALQAEVAELRGPGTGATPEKGSTGSTGAAGAKGTGTKDGGSPSAPAPGGVSGTPNPGTGTSAKELQKKLEEAAKNAQIESADGK